MDMIEALEDFDLLFEIARALLVFTKVVSTAKPFARVGFETESRPNMVNRPRMYTCQVRLLMTYR